MEQKCGFGASHQVREGEGGGRGWDLKTSKTRQLGDVEDGRKPWHFWMVLTQLAVKEVDGKVETELPIYLSYRPGF